MSGEILMAALRLDERKMAMLGEEEMEKGGLNGPDGKAVLLLSGFDLDPGEMGSLMGRVEDIAREVMDGWRRSEPERPVSRRGMTRWIAPWKSPVMPSCHPPSPSARRSKRPSKT